MMPNEAGVERGTATCGYDKSCAVLFVILLVFARGGRELACCAAAVPFVKKTQGGEKLYVCFRDPFGVLSGWCWRRTIGD